MAKGVHSKRTKRNKQIKRKALWEFIQKKEHTEQSNRLMKRTYGQGDDECITNKKNAFRYPNDPSAVFPQKKDPVFLDVRTSALPLSIISNLKGVKPQTRKRRELIETVQNEINSKKEITIDEEMIARENEVIDLNKLANIDNEIENLDLDNMDLGDGKKRRKKKHAQVEVEPEKKTDFQRKERQKKQAQKKSKSRFIVKF